MKTVSIYQKTPNGILRLGTFTPKKFYSVASVIDQVCAQHPNLDPSTIGVARRIWVMGKPTDTEPIWNTPAV